MEGMETDESGLGVNKVCLPLGIRCPLSLDDGGEEREKRREPDVNSQCRAATNPESLTLPIDELSIHRPGCSCSSECRSLFRTTIVRRITSELPSSQPHL